MLIYKLARFRSTNGIYFQRCERLHTLRHRVDKILQTKTKLVTQNQPPSSVTRWSVGLQFYRMQKSDALSNEHDFHNPFGWEVNGNDTPEVVEKSDPVPAGYWSSLFQVWRAPMPALLTGIASVAPLVGAPAHLYYFSTSFHPFIISVQLAYAAVILSFIGGIRWGFVIPYKYGSSHMMTWRAILQSIVPSLMAWSGLLMPDLTGGLLMVSAGLYLALYNDLRLFGDYPEWMMGLRCLLTTVAIVTLLASVILIEEKRMKNTFGGQTKNKLLDKNES